MEKADWRRECASTLGPPEMFILLLFEVSVNLEEDSLAPVRFRISLSHLPCSGSIEIECGMDYRENKNASFLQHSMELLDGIFKAWNV